MAAERTVPEALCNDVAATMGFPALAALAVGPGLVLVHVLWSRDRYREPLGNVALYLLIGALSVFPAAWIEGLLAGPILGGVVAGVEAVPTAVWAFLGVALVEEASKLGVLGLRARRDGHLDEPFDWVVYAVAVSLGFATLENVFYVMDGGPSVAIGRAFTAVPSHALDGTLMGWRLARASQRTGAAATRERVLALLEPAAWHGAYDYLLMMSSEAEATTGTVLVWLWIALVIGQWTVCAGRVRAMCRAQHLPLPPVFAPAEVAARVLHRGR
jgi:RsiW-degrading membrane proteinase PrsW (M82 family)